VHGLIAGALAPLASGGCVIYPPGFVARRFFEWMGECKPTWYTAVPTMHQAILASAQGNREIIARSPLRFIRSCSAPLSPTVMAELEEVFQVPVLEAYGMTETTHQITCNPLPPRARKPGSVGLPTGCRVSVTDDEGEMLPPGRRGEIVVDGDNVTFERGAGGSTAAAHANTSAIYTSAATPAATKIPVGVQTTLTPAAVTPILAATINEDPGTSHQANDVTAKSLESGAVLMIVADSVGVVALPTTETGTNLAWDHTAMRRGAALGRKQVFSTAIVPDSEEATAGTIYIPLPFDPSVVQIMVVTTSTGAMKLWNGDTIITVAAAGVPAYLTVNNDGSTDWTANETIYIIAVE